MGAVDFCDEVDAVGGGLVEADVGLAVVFVTGAVLVAVGFPGACFGTVAVVDLAVTGFPLSDFLTAAAEETVATAATVAATATTSVADTSSGSFSKTN